MIENETRQPGPFGALARVFGRTTIGVVGVGLMIAGVAMGVTMVMLPVGIVVGLTGAVLVASAVAASPGPR